MILVEFKDGFRGSVVFHRSYDFRNSRGPAFRQFQFLKEFTDSPVPVSSRQSLSAAQVFQFNGSIRSGIVDDGDFLLGDADFDGFPDVIGAVINGVDHGLLDRREGEILHAGGLGPVVVFDDYFVKCEDFIQFVLERKRSAKF